MEEMKEALLNLISQSLDAEFKQLESELKGEQPQISQNLKFRADVINEKKENWLQFARLQKETDALNVKNSQLELKISQMQQNIEKLCEVIKLQNRQETKNINLHPAEEVKENKELLDCMKRQEETHIQEVNELRKELSVKEIACHELEVEVSQVRRHPDFILMRQQLLDDLKDQDELHSREVKELRKELEAKDVVCRELELEISQVRQHPEFVLMRQQLLDDLKDQDESYLRQINGLRKELEAKDNLCRELNVKISQIEENPEFIRMRQQLLDDLKAQEERRLREVDELQKELDSKDFICSQLVYGVRQTPEFIEMREQLLDDLKGQEERHLLELNELRKELDSKDNICHQLENQVFGIRENPEFIEMREQLLDNLKGQEERHLHEMNELRNAQEAKDKQILEKEQEAEQLRNRLSLSVSCPICLDPWNSANHRMVALSCGHLFGESCIRQCLERNSLCPECRANASANEIRRLFTRS